MSKLVHRWFYNNWRRFISFSNNGSIRPRPLMIAIEGNVGVGKSTALDYLSKTYPLVTASQEPIATWRKTSLEETGENFNFLGLYMQNSAKYAFRFQVLVQNSYFRQIVNAYQEATDRQSSCLISERTVATNNEVFAKNLHSRSLLSPDQLAILRYCYDTNIALYPNMAMYDLIVYLHASPSTCYERSRSRKRPEEAVMKLCRFEELGIEYDIWRMNHFRPLNVKKVIDLDTDDMDLDIKNDMLRKIFASICCRDS